ncbi:hypothetical protein DFAR_2130003 [Desulfarculales bacterium]
MGQYLDLDLDWVVEKYGAPVAVVGCFAILGDTQISRYFELGCEIKGKERGHVKRIKDEVRAGQRPPAPGARAGHAPDLALCYPCQGRLRSPDRPPGGSGQ